MLNTTDIETSLKSIIIPYLDVDLLTAKALQHIKIEEYKVTLTLTFGFPAKNFTDILYQQLYPELVKLGVQELQLQIATKINAHQVQSSVAAIPSIKNIIVVASGKGGVGKSTLAVNLALALQQDGARVGLLDADIYGPSVPLMLGMQHAAPVIKENKRMQPVITHDLQTISIGYLVEEDTPMIWRGPMVSGALQQLLNETDWDNLDYLIVDLPPGTGDIQLTLAQKIPVSGAVIITTPQDMALLDARKAYGMFRKVKVNVLGLVENMSMHICSQCSHAEPIFGEGGGERMAKQYGITFLGRLPLDSRIRQHTDTGLPTMVAQPESDIAMYYREIARHTTARLSLEPRNFGAKFPKIVVE